MAIRMSRKPWVWLLATSVIALCCAFVFDKLGYGDATVASLFFALFIPPSGLLAFHVIKSMREDEIPKQIQLQDIVIPPVVKDEKSLSSEIGRTNRNLFLTNLVSLSIGLAICINYRQYLLSSISFNPVDFKKLTTGAGEHVIVDHYVKVIPEKLSETLFEETTTETRSGSFVRKYKSADFRIAAIDKKLLLIKFGSSGSTDVAIGFLKAMDSSFQPHLSELFKAIPKAELMLYPEYLDTSQGPIGGIFLALAVLVLLGWSIFNLGKWWLRNQNPEMHPVMKFLEKRAPNAIQLLENELKSDQVILGKKTITPSWIIQSTFYGVYPRPIVDIVWAYKYQLTTRTNFVVTTKKYSIILCLSTGEVRQIELASDNCDRVIVLLGKLAPWAFLGFSKDLETRWKKEAHAMMSEVAARRSGK